MIEYDEKIYIASSININIYLVHLEFNTFCNLEILFYEQIIEMSYFIQKIIEYSRKFDVKHSIKDVILFATRVRTSDFLS